MNGGDRNSRRDEGFNGGTKEHGDEKRRRRAHPTSSVFPSNTESPCRRRSPKPARRPAACRFCKTPDRSGVARRPQCGGAAPSTIYHGFCGCWVRRRPNRFLQAIRWLENLSSGENRAGCADRVGTASPVQSHAFYTPPQTTQPIR